MRMCNAGVVRFFTALRVGHALLVTVNTFTALTNMASIQRPFPRVSICEMETVPDECTCIHVYDHGTFYKLLACTSVSSV